MYWVDKSTSHEFEKENPSIEIEMRQQGGNCRERSWGRQSGDKWPGKQVPKLTTQRTNQESGTANLEEGVLGQRKSVQTTKGKGFSNPKK